MVNAVNIAFLTRSGICDLKEVISDLDAIEMNSRWQKLFIYISVGPAKNVCDQS